MRGDKMAADEGPGWWREKRRHHDAALKGKDGKRRSKHQRPEPQRISGKDLERLRRGARRNRSKWAMSMDTMRTAKTVYDPRDSEQVKKWRKHPDRADLNGVDTLSQHLYGIKVKAVSEVEERKKRVRTIIADARKRAVKGRREARTKEGADKAVTEALVTAREALATVGKEVKGIISGAKDEQNKKIRRFQGKWGPERKRRAEYVAKTVGCNLFEADALIQRAKRAGIDYDLVNWDAIQGKDLEYSEKVEKLDQAIHKETMTKDEEDHYIDWQIAKAQDEWEEYVKQQEEQLHDEAWQDRQTFEEGKEENRDYYLQFEGPQDNAENDLYENG